MPRGFLYLVAIMDWRLSNTLEVDFCLEALEEALSKGKPKIFDYNQVVRNVGALSIQAVQYSIRTESPVQDRQEVFA